MYGGGSFGTKPETVEEMMDLGMEMVVKEDMNAKKDVCNDGVDMSKRGTIKYYFSNCTSKGNVGAPNGDIKGYGGGDRMNGMMVREIPLKQKWKKLLTGTKSKTIVKNKRGAKTRALKGKLTGDWKHDSSQKGIKECLTKKSGNIGVIGTGIGIRKLNSLGTAPESFIYQL